MKGQAKRAKAQKENIMEKIILGKIIGAVRDLEVKKSKNNTQFDFYWKKKHRIERKERRMIKETINKEAVEYYKKNKETLNFCYQFMDKIENENKAINNQIKQYLNNYVLITLVDKLNKLKVFSYKKLHKIVNDINKEASKIHYFDYHFIYASENEHELYLDTVNNRRTIILDDYIKYIESHLTKKTITKKFEIDDFKNFITWDIKTPEQEVQDNATTENELNELKNKIEKLISNYNQERKKLTINQDNYKYMYMGQD